MFQSLHCCRKLTSTSLSNTCYKAYQEAQIKEMIDAFVAVELPTLEELYINIVVPLHALTDNNWPWGGNYIFEPLPPPESMFNLTHAAWFKQIKLLNLSTRNMSDPDNLEKFVVSVCHRSKFNGVENVLGMRCRHCVDGDDGAYDRCNFRFETFTGA